MNLHQYRVLQALAAKWWISSARRDAIEAAVRNSFRMSLDLCDTCGCATGTIPVDRQTEICRECADKGE